MRAGFDRFQQGSCCGRARQQNSHGRRFHLRRHLLCAVHDLLPAPLAVLSPAASMIPSGQIRRRLQTDSIENRSQHFRVFRLKADCFLRGVDASPVLAASASLTTLSSHSTITLEYDSSAFEPQMSPTSQLCFCWRPRLCFSSSMNAASTLSVARRIQTLDGSPGDSLRAGLHALAASVELISVKELFKIFRTCRMSSEMFSNDPHDMATNLQESEMNGFFVFRRPSVSLRARTSVGQKWRRCFAQCTDAATVTASARPTDR